MNKNAKYQLLSCIKVELQDLTICFTVNGEKFEKVPSCPGP